MFDKGPPLHPERRRRHSCSHAIPLRSRPPCESRLRLTVFAGLLPAFRATSLRKRVHLPRTFVDADDIDRLFYRKMFTTLCLPQLLLVPKLLCQRLVNFTAAVIVRVAPQTAIAVTVVAPAWVVNDRVQTQSFQLDARGRSRTRLLTDIAQP